MANEEILARTRREARLDAAWLVEGPGTGNLNGGQMRFYRYRTGPDGPEAFTAYAKDVAQWREAFLKGGEPSGT